MALIAGPDYGNSLLPAVQDSGTESTPSGGVMPEAAPSQPACATVLQELFCTVSGETADVVYRPNQLNSADLADTAPADGIPDRAARTVEALDAAWSYFHDDLGYDGPARVQWGWNVIPLVNDRAASLPGGVIVAPAYYDEGHLPVHELFHQFQWRYMSSAFSVVGVPITAGGALATSVAALTEAVNLVNINWWMEATAEWATTKYAAEEKGEVLGKSTAALAADNLGVFFQTPGQKLAAGNPVTETRHYGELAVVEYFTSFLDDAAFVRKTFEKMRGWFYLDGESHLENTLVDEYRYESEALLPGMWNAQYLLCDPASHGLSDNRLDGWWIHEWCEQMRLVDGLTRPAHDTISLATGQSSQTIAAGGAWFSDLSTTSTGLAEKVVVLDVTSSDLEHTSVWVDNWADTPGVWCAGGELEIKEVDGSPARGHIELTTDLACPNATISVVNTSLSGPDITVSTRWSVVDSWAVISNGTLALTVSAYGALRLGYEPVEGEEPRPVAFTYLPSGTDVLAAATYDDCWGVGQIDPESEDELRGGFSCGPDVYGQPVNLEIISFTHTATEATSVVRVGPAEIVQRFHPSPSANAYQFDLTIRESETIPLGSDDYSVTYRRIMNAYMAEGEDERLDDYVAITHAPADSQVTAYTNQTWSGNARIKIYRELEPVTPAAELYDEDTFHQGFALDLTVHGVDPAVQPLPTPQVTLYYGAVPPQGAAQVLQSLGARTYGLVTPPAGHNSDPEVTFFLAH